jgi:uridine kinase
MSDMVQSTGSLNHFDLTFLGNNDLVLSYPITEDLSVPAYTPHDMILKSFTDYNKWSDLLHVKYVADLNKIISDSKIKEFIKKNDIMMDNQIYQIAYTIMQEKRKIILLGGPSSSGKTTSTRKLALYLSAIGLNPIYLGLDNYFKERNQTPKNEKGEYDYESLEAIDLDLFNNNLIDLLTGKKVKIPTYNFITGEKEYKTDELELKPNDIILIEGLHCLNEELTKNIPSANKLKVYISPFTPLNIDRHNHLSTVDIRLLRRIVRDNRTRGYSVIDTLKSWDNVRNGETKYVFPFTNEANIILNTAFIYELGVLRVYVEPLLYSVPIDSKYYNESRRLINELQMFFPIPSEYLADSNILREFIGGSYFEER